MYAKFVYSDTFKAWRRELRKLPLLSASHKGIPTPVLFCLDILQKGPFFLLLIFSIDTLLIYLSGNKLDSIMDKVWKKDRNVLKLYQGIGNECWIYHHGCAFSSGIIFCDVSKRFVSISPAFEVFWPWFVIGCWIAFRSRISSCALARFYGLAATTSTAIFASIAAAATVVLTCVFLRKKEESREANKNQFPFLFFLWLAPKITNWNSAAHSFQ